MNINNLPDFPNYTRSELEYIFMKGISDEAREMVDKNEYSTAESLLIGKVVVALAMQYTTEGYVDVHFLISELKRLSFEGIKTVLIAGTTGESTHLSEVEHLTYIRLASAIAKKYGLTIIAGAGSNNTSEQIELVDGSFGGDFLPDPTIMNQLDEKIELDSSVVATLLLPPYYIKTDNANLIRHFLEGLNRGPSIIYSIKARTGMEIPLEVIEILSQHPNFIGVKECDGQDRISYLVNKGITVWTGNDDTMVQDVNLLGGYGVISVTAGIIPSKVNEIIYNGKTSGLEVEQNNIASRLLFPGIPNPIMVHNVHNIINYNGETQATFRLPTGPISQQQQEWALKYMHILGLSGTAYGDNYRLIS